MRLAGTKSTEQVVVTAPLHRSARTVTFPGSISVCIRSPGRVSSGSPDTACCKHMELSGSRCLKRGCEIQMSRLSVSLSVEIRRILVLAAPHMHWIKVDPVGFSQSLSSLDVRWCDHYGHFRHAVK